jgi:hypothetical protein
MVSSMGLACGEVIEEIPTKESGNLANLKDMVCILGLMAILTKVNLNSA